MQGDLDAFLEAYNRESPPQDCCMNGRTPYEAFTRGLTPKAQEKEETAAVVKAA